MKKLQSLSKSAAFYCLLILWASLTFSSALTNVSFFTAMTAWVVWRFHEPVRNFLPKKLLLPLIVFFSLIILSAFFSEYPSNSVRGLLKLCKQILIFLMTFDVFREKGPLRTFEKIFLFVAWLIFVDAISQYVFGRDFLRWKEPEPSGSGVRLSASFGTYGKFASFLVLTLPYLFAMGNSFLQKHSDSSRRILSYVLCAGLFGTLLLTRSRGAILAFAISLVLLLIFQRKFLWLSILLIVGGISLSLLPKNILIHLDAEKKEQSVVERFYLWDRAAHVIKAKPLLGTGINTYAQAHAKYDTTNNWRVRNYYAHNGYLQLAAETGIPCLIAFLWFLGAYFCLSLSNLKAHAQDRQLRLGLLTGILAFLVFALVDTVLQNPLPVMTFWFVLGLQLAYVLPAASGSRE